MKILAIVTARGGSKGVPGKNIRPLNGTPLIGYTIKAAKDSPVIDRVMITTDSNEIAKVAETFGCEVPFIRPDELARDETPTLPVLQHAVKYLEETEGYKPDYILTLQPTSPFRTAKHIEEAVHLLEDKPESVISVTQAKHHPFWMKKIIDGKLFPYQETDKSYTRRQDLPDVFVLNGALFLTRIDVLMEKNDILGNDVKPYIMDETDSVDIDNESDFIKAEYLLNKNKRGAL